MSEATNQPGRTVRMPRAQRREHLLKAAVEIFVRNGYHATAMEDIADHAGVSKPVLYQHFPGKRELYLALLSEQCDQLSSLVRTALQSSEDPKTRMEAAMAAFFEYVDREDGAYRLLFESDLGNDPEVAEVLKRAERASAGAIADRVVQDTDLPRFLADYVGAAFAGMAEMAALKWLSDPDNTLTRQEAAQTVAALAWRGIGAFPTKALNRAHG